ncbi:peptidase M75, Imelysin [Mesorhizobium sp. Root157]|uniref:imelysin family protein n=1 Tax=Mesorhizobium sp. Root157 TaxID=1736477 RepID=UPI0006FB2B4F|nr:imelysin family protein [Mesorhizobium sp. Root157]KQZ93843.1 peptidase M75, Imelysin [Mesorhizobium sp. Root157]
MKLKRLTVAVALPFSLLLAQPAQAAVKASDVIGQAINGFIRPAYADLHERAAALSTSMQTLCATPNDANLDSARSAFSEAAMTWSSVEIIAFGPIREGNRFERMLFWPDRKSIGLKQVQAALAASDPSAAEASQMEGKSVAMQGFGALEYLLFGTDADILSAKDGAYRCAFGSAVAGNIETMSGEVSVEWNKPDGFAAVWANPASDNPVYRTGSEAVTELMGVFINGLDMIRDVRLKGFLGNNPDADKPRQAIYWRSQRTAASLAANLDGMDRLFQSSHLIDALSPDARWIAESIHIQLVNGVASANAVSGPIDKTLADPGQRKQLDQFALVTSSLSNLFGTRLSAEFGLTAGFSSLDGD